MAGHDTTCSHNSQQPCYDLQSSTLQKVWTLPAATAAATATTTASNQAKQKPKPTATATVTAAKALGENVWFQNDGSMHMQGPILLAYFLTEPVIQSKPENRVKESLGHDVIIK